MQSAVRIPAQLYRQMYRLARLWVRGLLAVASLAMAGIISILLGLNTAPQTAPIFNIVRQSPVVSLAIGGFVLFATLTAVQVLRAPEPRPGDATDPALSAGWHVPRLIISTAISTISTTLLVALLAIVLARPSWCPSALCPAARTIAVTNPHGAHDGNLEVYFTTLESDTFVIPGDPGQFTMSNAPEAVGAIRTDSKTPSVYRVVFGVHSLQQGRFGMILTKVGLLVTQVPPTPHPLNVWIKGIALDYNSDPFLVTYEGQAAGDLLPAVYVPLPGQHVQLSPGEADEVDLQVASRIPVDLKFRVQVTYRVVNETSEHTVVLPQEFEVAFSDASNWHIYQSQGGPFVAAP